MLLTSTAPVNKIVVLGDVKNANFKGRRLERGVVLEQAGGLPDLKTGQLLRA